jgi:hypothetical protein
MKTFLERVRQFQVRLNSVLGTADSKRPEDHLLLCRKATARLGEIHGLLCRFDSLRCELNETQGLPTCASDTDTFVFMHIDIRMSR